jgi:CheY-like chemotaxis protein
MLGVVLNVLCLAIKKEITMVKVLIVEDDPLMSRMYQKIFSFEKFEVELAGDGEEGLSKAASFGPTIILCDVMMPKMNGLQVLEKLKADPKTKQIPVVMLTNLAGQQDAEAALAKGAVKYIIKSEHDPKEIVNMVKEIIAGYTRNDIPQAATVQDSPHAQTISAALPTDTTVSNPPISSPPVDPNPSVSAPAPTPAVLRS